MFTFRWFIVHNSFVYYAREMFAKINIGPVPPPILLLSDGGHVENLGILPLLKRRLSRIVVVDGGYKGRDTLFGKSIISAMHLARIKLKCSFLTEDGKDVISDLLEKLATNPRYYKYAFVLLSHLVCLSRCRERGTSLFVFNC